MGNLKATEGKPPKPPRVARNGLHILLEIFGSGFHSSRSSELADVVLIAIDFEKLVNIEAGFARRQSCQVGLAILDTKKINQGSLDKLISTYNFVTGPPSYYKRVGQNFSFGESTRIHPSEIVDRIQSLIPPGRNVVLVGHGIACDLCALQILGFQFPVRLSSIIDTSRIAQEILGKKWIRLVDLLERLESPFDKIDLHCAGNDATFTLRALLLLAARGFSNQERDLDGDCDMIDLLQQLSNYPTPYTKDLKVQVSDEWISIRGRQAKTWDKEKADQTRAARRDKREDVDSCFDAFALFDQS